MPAVKLVTWTITDSLWDRTPQGYGYERWEPIGGIITNIPQMFTPDLLNQISGEGLAPGILSFNQSPGSFSHSSSMESQLGNH